MGSKHDAEYFRKRRAAKRQEAIANGTFGIGESGRYSKPSTGRQSSDLDCIPADVFARGRVLTAMLNTPICMWLAEWTSDI